MRETVVVLPANQTVVRVEPGVPPQSQIDTFRSYGRIHAVVVDTLPTWGWRVFFKNGRRYLHLRASQPTSFRILTRPSNPPPLPQSLVDTVDLLIIAPQRFRQAVETYAALREQYGVRTVIIDLEETLENPGGSRAEKLRRFLQQYAQTRALRHVFLVGPVPEVPVVYTRIDGIYSPLPFYERVPTDIFYSYENPGPWNVDGDTLIGEVDDYVDPRLLIPRFAVGRLVVQDPSDVIRYTQKVQRYLLRKDPPVYLFHGPFIAPSVPGSYFLQQPLQVLPSTATPHTLFEENGRILQDTFFYWFDRSDLVLGVAHGYNDLYEINFSPWDDARTPAFIRDSTSLPSIFYPIACEILAYDEGGLAVFALSGEGGPVAMYGMSRLDFPDYSKFLATWFMQALNNGARTLGEVDQSVREALRMYTNLTNSLPRYLFFGYTLLGDPSLPVRTQSQRLIPFSSLPLRIQPTASSWWIQGDIPGSRMVVWTSGERNITTSPYDEIWPFRESLWIRVLLPDAAPETLLTHRGGFPPYLDVSLPSEAVEGDTLTLSASWRLRDAESLQISLPGTTWVMAVPPEGHQDFPYKAVYPGGGVRIRLWGPEGNLEKIQDLHVFPRFPTFAGVLVDPETLRFVFTHFPQAWKGGTFFLDSVGVTLPRSPGPPVWVSPPFPRTTGDTLSLHVEVPDQTWDTVISIADTLPREGGLISRPIPGGVEIYAIDSVCEAYLWLGDTLLLQREALPYRTTRYPLGPVACFRNGIGSVTADSIPHIPGYALRPPFPLNRSDFLFAYTGPIGGHFLSDEDIALIGQDGRIHVVDPQTGDIQFYARGEPTAEIFTEAAVGDLDGDGWEDFLVPQRYPSGIRGFRGGQDFFLSLPVNVLWSPLVWDMDEDERDEAYLPYQGVLHRIRWNGTWKVDTVVTLTNGWTWSSRPALGEDHRTLLIGAKKTGEGALLRVYPDGQVDTLRRTTLPVQALAVGDLWGGGGLEVVTVGQDSGWVLKDTLILSRFSVSLRTPQIALVDWDQDGLLDIVLSERDANANSYWINVRDATGSVKFTSPETWVLGMDFGTPFVTCGNVILYGNRGDDLYLWGTTPSRMFMGHKLGSGVWIDTTGALWIASFLGPLWALDAPLSCGETDWRTAYHDRRRTANAGVRESVPVVEIISRSQKIPMVLRVSQHPWLDVQGLRLFDRLGRLIGRDRVRLRGLPYGVYVIDRKGKRQKVVILP